MHRMSGKFYGFITIGKYMAQFPSVSWVNSLMDKLNLDEHYENSRMLYHDLWHGKCRAAYLVSKNNGQDAAFKQTASCCNIVNVLNGDVDPLQALRTRKLGVNGNMTVPMHSVPTVLDFVRCCWEITDSFK